VTRYVALLRGVNVSGRQRVSMEALRAAVTGAGFEDVATYIQSGNVVCSSPRRSAAAVGAALEAAIEDGLGVAVRVIVRSAGDLDRILAENPFVARRLDPATLHVTLLAADPAQGAGRLEVAAGADEFEARGREIYLHCPGGYGRSALTNTFFERRLGVAATTRNWKTMTRLHEMARPTPTARPTPERRTERAP
jgi:uncharacterized protein (DUF1697 family)